MKIIVIGSIAAGVSAAARLAAGQQDQPVRDAVESGADKLGSQTTMLSYLGGKFAFDAFLTHT